MLFQSRVPAVMAQLYAEMQSKTTTARKDEAVKRDDYYHSEQDAYTVENMATWMSEPETLRPLQINIVRRVIDNLPWCTSSPQNAY